MTHNHGSTTNTAIWHYFDSADVRKACADDAKQISKACGEEYETDESRKNKADKDKGVSEKNTKLNKLKKLVSFKQGGKKGNDVTWKDNNCKGLTLKPRKDSIDEFKKEYEEISEKVKELGDINVSDLIDEAYEMAKDEIKSMAAKTAAKVVAKSALKSWLGPIGWAWTAYDVVSSAMDIKDLYDLLDELKKEVTENIERVKKAIPQIDDILNKDINSIKQSDVAEAMKLYANMNPCTRARRCKLVTYKESTGRNGQGQKNKSKGCCPGQTGHHLIPDSFMHDAPITSTEYLKDADNRHVLDGSKKKIKKTRKKGAKRCKKYSTSGALTMCVEGISSTDGSHGDAHKAFEDALGSKTSENISYEETLKAAVKSAKTIAPQCDSKCIAKQLMKHYDSACGKEDKPPLRRASIPVSVEKQKDETFGR